MVAKVLPKKGTSSDKDNIADGRSLASWGWCGAHRVDQGCNTIGEVDLFIILQ